MVMCGLMCSVSLSCNTLAQQVRAGKLFPSTIGEDDMLASWVDFLMKRGVDQGLAVDQATRMGLLSLVLCQGYVAAPDENVPTPNVWDCLPFDATGAFTSLEEQAEADVPPAAESCVQRPWELEEVPQLPAGTFVASVQKRSNFRRLHVIGKCPLAPGVDYVHFEVHGLAEPPANRHIAKCKNCFR